LRHHEVRRDTVLVVDGRDIDLRIHIPAVAARQAHRHVSLAPLADGGAQLGHGGLVGLARAQLRQAAPDDVGRGVGADALVRGVHVFDGIAGPRRADQDDCVGARVDGASVQPQRVERLVQVGRASLDERLDAARALHAALHVGGRRHADEAAEDQRRERPGAARHRARPSRDTQLPRHARHEERVAVREHGVAEPRLPRRAGGLVQRVVQVGALRAIQTGAVQFDPEAAALQHLGFLEGRADQRGHVDDDGGVAQCRGAAGGSVGQRRAALVHGHEQDEAEMVGALQQRQHQAGPRLSRVDGAHERDAVRRVRKQVVADRDFIPQQRLEIVHDEIARPRGRVHEGERVAFHVAFADREIGPETPVRRLERGPLGIGDHAVEHDGFQVRVAGEKRPGKGAEFVAGREADRGKQCVRRLQHVERVAEAAGDGGIADFRALQEFGTGPLPFGVDHADDQDGSKTQSRQQCENCGGRRRPRAGAAEAHFPCQHAPS
jgi:hypothetical protein